MVNTSSSYTHNIRQLCVFVNNALKIKKVPGKANLAFPSMEKILRERFKMDVVSLNVKIFVEISKKIGKYLGLAIDGCQARMALA
jgi:hypothetical protein